MRKVETEGWRREGGRDQGVPKGGKEGIEGKRGKGTRVGRRREWRKERRERGISEYKGWSEVYGVT